MRWLWIAVAVIWALGGIRMFLFHLSYDPFADIHIYYEAAARLNAGEPLYPPGARIYPPLFSILFRPLALLPFELAAAIWEGILLAALGLTLWLIGIRNRSTWWAVLILSIGIAWTLAIGQVEAIVTLLLAIGSPFTVALAGNIKVFPLAVGIFWLVRGDWRSVLRLAAWTAGLVALQLVLDPANTLAFPATLAPGQVASEVASEGNLSPFVLAPILWAIVVVSRARHRDQVRAHALGLGGGSRPGGPGPAACLLVQPDDAPRLPRRTRGGAGQAQTGSPAGRPRRSGQVSR